jgi:RecA-family ATPase
MIDYTAGPIPALEDVAVRLNGPIKEGPPDLIAGLMPRQGQLVIAGETNTGKSLISLEMISCLTTGKPLWGELEPTKQLKKVLYVLGEHYVEVIQRLLKVTGLEMPDNVFILGPEQLMFDKWLVTRGQPNIQATQKFMKWAEGCDLIVFDPLSAFVNGVDAENDNVQMRLVLDTMSLIAQSTGASCLVLAHQGKPMMNSYGQETKRKSYAIRGASGIEDAATNIFYLERGDSGDVVAKATGGQVFELTCRKFKGAAPDKYTLLRNNESLTHRMLTGKPYAEVMKIDGRAKVARIMEHNDKIEHRTAVALVAATEGVSEETMRRRLGLA